MRDGLVPDGRVPPTPAGNTPVQSFQKPFVVEIERGRTLTRVAAGADDGWAHLLFDVRGSDLMDFRLHSHVQVRLDGRSVSIENAGVGGSLERQQAHCAVKLGHADAMTVEYFASRDDAVPVATETFVVTDEHRRRPS